MRNFLTSEYPDCSGICKKIRLQEAEYTLNQKIWHLLLQLGTESSQSQRELSKP